MIVKAGDLLSGVIVPKGQRVFFRTAQTAQQWARAFNGKIIGTKTVEFTRDIFLQEKPSFTQDEIRSLKPAPIGGQR